MAEQKQTSPTALAWQQRLDRARSEADVVSVVREFVTEIGNDALERLPEDLRPGRFKDAADVTTYAFSVVLHRLQGGVEVAELIQSMATFFMSAATRLTQIMARAHLVDKDPAS